MISLIAPCLSVYMTFLMVPSQHCCDFFQTPDSGIAADMGNQESDHSVPVTPQSPEDTSIPDTNTQAGLRFRGHTDFQERDGYVFVNNVCSRPNSMASFPVGNVCYKGLGGQAHLGEPLSNSDFDVSTHGAGPRKAYTNVSERTCDLTNMPPSFMSTNSDLGFYSGHFGDPKGHPGRRPLQDSVCSASQFSTPASGSSESLIERSGICAHDMSFISNSMNNSVNDSALGHQGPIDINAQSVKKHSTPNSEGAPVKFAYMSSSINQDGSHQINSNNRPGSISSFYPDSFDNSGNMSSASYHASGSFHGTPYDVHNHNRSAVGNVRFGQRSNRRPSSANNSCWPPQRGDGGAMKRQHSYGSDLSGLSDYSVREGFRDKGYSVDLGENLSGLDTPDSDMFEAQDVGGGTVSHIELIQNQLQTVILDIEDMNTKVEGLNSREDIARDCYTLGCGEFDDKLRVTPRRRTHRSGSYRSRSSSLDCTSDEVNPENRRSYHYQGEYMWDYQSDLAHNDNQFVARRPFVGDSVFSSEYESEHSRSQSPKLEHIKKYLEDSARSPMNCSGVERSQTINSIADLYIDDDYSGLASPDSNANIEEDDTRRRPFDPHSRSRLLRPSPPGRSVSPGAPSHKEPTTNVYNDINSPGAYKSCKGYHSPKLKVHHNICPNCSCSNLSCDASTSTSPIHQPTPEYNVVNNNLSVSPQPCNNCSPAQQVSPRSNSRASPPGSLVRSEPRWSVTNVEEKCNLYEYAATEWKGDTAKATNIRKVSNITHIHTFICMQHIEFF